MDPANPPPPAASPLVSAADILRQHIAEHGDALLLVIRSYVVHLGAAHGQPVKEVASEILNEMTVRALSTADRFDPAKRPRSWLLGIAWKLILQRRDAVARLRQHELNASTLLSEADDEETAKFFDQLADLARQRAGDDRSAAILNDLLAQATPEDREILVQVDLQGWDYAALARQTGISVAALRKRHHRAIKHLQQIARQNGGRLS
jgi:RNA polymerase sigma factor (sigma-70 family)